MVHKERLGVSKEYEPKFNETMTKIKATQSQFEERWTGSFIFEVEQATKDMAVYILEGLAKLEGISEKDF